MSTGTAQDVPEGSNRNNPMTTNANYTPSDTAVPGSNWALIPSIPRSNFRNGDVSEVTSMLIKATVPARWHWMPVAGIAPEFAVNAIDAYILSSLAQLTASPPQGVNTNTIRKLAIVIGTARAVATSTYRLIEGDFIPGELAKPILMVSGTNPDSGKYTYRVVANAITDGLMTDALELTEIEQAAIAQLVKCAVGLIPMQGYSLIMTNHHYLSDAKSQAYKVYEAVEKAYWKGRDVEDFFTTDVDHIRDALWHKACHPVSINLKMESAMNPKTKEMINAAGCGACASRLPAVESQLRAAGSYMTLVQTVKTLIEIVGGKVDCSGMETAIAAVSALPRGTLTPAEKDALPEGMREVVNSRAEGIQYLDRVLERNKNCVAYCYGFYIALTDANAMMSGASNLDTLRASNSLTKLKTNGHASYIAGMEFYKDYNAMRARDRADGRVLAPEFILE